jgi:thiol-disulfide isomerase/thioredoxin
MNKITLILFLSILSHMSFSQNWASTNPENKKAIVEEFTGTSCLACPGGHTVLDELSATYGNQVCIAGYHPSNSPFSDPAQAGDENFGRDFPNAFCDPNFNFTGTYPSAFVNRRMFSGNANRNFYKGDWEDAVQEIIAEASPLNVGLNPVYNTDTKQLTIDVEAYFTSDVSDDLKIYVIFTEDHLIAAQKNGSVIVSDYEHFHVFREALCDDWGDDISGETTEGSLFSDTYTYDNVDESYIMENCDILVFVRNADNEEIITGNKKAVEIITTSPEIMANSANNINIYPNPVSSNTFIQLDLNEDSDISYSIHNSAGMELSNYNLNLLPAGSHNIPLEDVSGIASGLYYLRISINNTISHKKFIIQ